MSGAFGWASGGSGSRATRRPVSCTSSACCRAVVPIAADACFARLAWARLLLRREPIRVAPDDARTSRVGIQRLHALVEGSEKLLVALVSGEPAGGEVGIGLP